MMSRINRICAWVLLASVFVYIVSGLDIQGRLLSPKLSTAWHLIYLFPVAELAFTFHASYAMHRAFGRWGLKKGLSTGLVAAFVALNAAASAYYLFIHFIR